MNLRFPLAGAPDDPAARLVRPEADAEVENYLVSGRYETALGERFFWNAGGSWDRNSDAGILDETVADGGADVVLGTRRVLKDRLDTVFRTALVVSF